MISGQVNAAMTRASVCMAGLPPQQQAELATRMQAVADALADDSRISRWPFWGSLQPWVDRSDRCVDLAGSLEGSHQAGYAAFCLDWEGHLAGTLQQLAAYQRSVGCLSAAEVTESAADGVLAEGEQAAAVLPSPSNLEIPGLFRAGGVVLVALLALRLVRG